MNSGYYTPFEILAAIAVLAFLTQAGSTVLQFIRMRGAEVKVISSKLRIPFLRGDAREVRLGAENPEMTEAALWLVPAVVVGLAIFSIQGTTGALGGNAFGLVFFVPGIP